MESATSARAEVLKAAMPLSGDSQGGRESDRVAIHEMKARIECFIETLRLDKTGRASTPPEVSLPPPLYSLEAPPKYEGEPGIALDIDPKTSDPVNLQVNGSY